MIENMSFTPKDGLQLDLPLLAFYGRINMTFTNSFGAALVESDCHGPVALLRQLMALSMDAGLIHLERLKLRHCGEVAEHSEWNLLKRCTLVPRQVAAKRLTLTAKLGRLRRF
jgi:hypothetical protein